MPMEKDEMLSILEHFFQLELDVPGLDNGQRMNLQCIYSAERRAAIDSVADTIHRRIKERLK